MDKCIIFTVSHHHHHHIPVQYINTISITLSSQYNLLLHPLSFLTSLPTPPSSPHCLHPSTSPPLTRYPPLLKNCDGAIILSPPPPSNLPPLQTLPSPSPPLRSPG
ncbi:hypothetical protein E2C01_078360 [Portunus trituberculatus]|uniref:Uncharacterized protein n=1 Tax=Portunus trituberculatus TaxID=210409 RepID=A0A5B7IPX7_PORTR|nr:hypothetical protein [Portunus trituberculatus]